jgi:N-acetylneuraminate synthase
MRKEPYLIAEIGCNHCGDFKIASQMVRVAKMYCGVDAVKFQKRTVRELLSEEQYNSPHPNPGSSYGQTYGAHRDFLEFSIEQHCGLQRLCRDIGAQYMTSVWDKTAAKEILSLGPATIKIGSPSNLDFDLVDYICENHPGDIHVSLGMTTRHEEKLIVDFLTKKGRAKDTVLYACTSGYPVPLEQVCLLEITRLRKEYGSIVGDIGFSGHHHGIVVDIAAYALGARYIERHFTFDHTWKGTDHSSSLEPDDMRQLRQNLYSTHNRHSPDEASS